MPTIAELRQTEPSFVTPVDVDALTTSRVAAFKQDFPDWTGDSNPGDPIHRLIRSGAQNTFVNSETADAKARSILLPWAFGNTLDAIASATGTTRRSGETDEELRLRIPVSFLGKPAAGTLAAVETAAYQASSDVLDVQFIEAANRVDGQVSILSGEDPEEGSLAGTASVSLISTVQTAEEGQAEPLGAVYTTISAVITAYTVEAVLRYDDDLFTEAAVLAAARSRLYGYIQSRYKLNVGVFLNGIQTALNAPVDAKGSVTAAGAVHTVITAPATDLAAVSGGAYLCPQDTTNVVLTAQAA